MEPWYGVDLDGTLARCDIEKNGVEDIGEPVPLMMEAVKGWLALGIKVKIFTARASREDHIPPVQKWLDKHGLGFLEITCKKDFKMILLFDDRARQVIENTGKIVEEVPDGTSQV